MLYTKELENLRREAETTSASAKQGFTFDKMFEASKDFASAWSVQGKKVPYANGSCACVYACVCVYVCVF